jgi:streptomycin 3"-adenylyltransferase
VDAPPAARAQLEKLTNGLRAILGDTLVGTYIHGSLALGCFNAARSDIDVILALAEPLELDTKLQLVDLLLHVSASPYAIELDALTVAQLAEWRHPSPHELHYSEWSRERFAHDPIGRLAELDHPNADLAAHLTVARAAGITLVGPPPRDVFPEVPFADFRDSLLRDLDWARDVRSALYGILSPCRVWAALATREIHSKESGARWTLERLPADLQPLVRRALASYAGAGEPIDVDEDERRRLLDYVETQLRQ